MSSFLFLAARIDDNFEIKVADFGLSEDVYDKNYFRQAKEGEKGEEESQIKLPIKWMALESLTRGLFSEKTDVVSLHIFFAIMQRNV